MSNAAGHIYWFTGLSGSGKSTLADNLAERLRSQGRRVRIIDGDVVRQSYPRPLGYSRADIIVNNRAIVEECHASRKDYDIIIVPVISPLRESRSEARQRLSPGFFEVYVAASLTTVVERDTKGLYAKARRQEIADMIGFSRDGVAYEPPVDADLVLETGDEPVSASAKTLYEFVCGRINVKDQDRVSDPDAPSAGVTALRSVDDR